MTLWELGEQWHRAWEEVTVSKYPARGDSKSNVNCKAALALLKEACKGKSVLIDFEKYLLNVSDETRKRNGRIIKKFRSSGAKVRWLVDGGISRHVFVNICILANVPVDLSPENFDYKRADVYVA